MFEKRTTGQQKQRDLNVRPWGHFQTPAFLPCVGSLKFLTVHPGQRLPLQRHLGRTEHWVVLSGRVTAEVDEKQIQVSRGEHVEVPRGTWHRLRNGSSEEVAIIAEVQVSEYETAQLAEDDIERRQGDYGRA